MKNIFKYVYRKFFAMADHEGYARHIGVRAGSNFHIYGNPYNMFGTDPWAVTLGNNVYITHSCLFITHDGATLLFRGEVPDLEITRPITVGSNVYFGVGSIMLPGVEIGNNCIIGAGSVVTKDIPDNSVVGGSPAVFLESYNDYFEKAKKKSLHLGHLKGKEKDIELRKYYNR